MKINCIAIDDEKYALDLVIDNIRRIPYLNLIGGCRNVKEAKILLDSNVIHLIFTDIQMPGLSGLQFVEKLRVRPIIIFITAFENYAINAFNLDAIDYLVKPVCFDRFLHAANKVLLFYNGDLSVGPKNKNEVPYIFVSVEYNFLKINLIEIFYIEALKDYAKIHLVHGKKTILTRSSLKSILELLPSHQYIRIHKSFIVPVSSIYTITKDSIILNDGMTELPIGDGYKNQLLLILRK